MSTPVQVGRFRARFDGEVTVFLIGMRFNHPLQPRKWVPVFLAMPRMLRHLETRPEAGMLGGQLWFGRTTLLLSYWRDEQALFEFARASTAPHREAWKRFNRAVGSDGSVGIWHETYTVTAQRTESIYTNMPVFGLGAATHTAPVTGAGLRTASLRS